MRRALGLLIVAACGGSAPAANEPSGAAPSVAAAERSRPAASAPTGPLELSQLLSYADAHAPSLRVALSRAGLEAADLEAATLPHNPEASLSVGGRTIDDETRFEIEAALEQRFEIAGQAGARREAAERSRDAASAGAEAIRFQLHTAVRRLYYEALVRGAELGASEDLVAFAAQLEEISQKRVAVGEESPLESIIARAEIAHARQEWIAARQRERLARAELAALIGWPPGRELTVTGALPRLVKPPPLATLWRRARVRHPDLAALEAARVAAEARVESEDRAAFPDPALGLSYAREAEADGAAHVWLATLRVPLPLFERNQAPRARARAEQALAGVEAEARAARLESELSQALAAVEAAAERVELYGGDILPALAENLAKLKRAFELGEIDLLKLTQIREKILTTRREALAALGDYYQALGELEALSGAPLGEGEP